MMIGASQIDARTMGRGENNERSLGRREWTDGRANRSLETRHGPSVQRERERESAEMRETERERLGAK